MTNPEQIPQPAQDTEVIPGQPTMPPGILKAEHLADNIPVGQDVLPWIGDGEYSTSVSRVTAQDGTEFLLSSALDSHKRLTRAAEGMTDHQRTITDNMFYSRIAGFVDAGHSSAIDTLPVPATPFPIHVMRNKGGQRVYFGVANLSLDPKNPDTKSPVVMRLGVCDKNRQIDVMKVLSGLSPRKNREKMRGSK